MKITKKLDNSWKEKKTKVKNIDENPSKIPNIKKSKLHKNNIHQGRYDLNLLTKNLPELKGFIKKNPKNEDTIDFSNSDAVVYLNKALLKTYYNILEWNIPVGFLCPPIPGRVDYIHYISDLLKDKKDKIKVLDIGTGASCIYPILGTQSYNWNFVGSDIDLKSIESSQSIIDKNKSLIGKIELRLQEDKNQIFKGIIKEKEQFDLTMCNPPFHASLEDAIKANERKVRNLNKKGSVKKGMNFGGQKAELWCKGGEKLFLKKMVKESEEFSTQVKWFTSLISNKDNLKPTIRLIEKLDGKHKILEMSQGQKISRVLAWTFCK